MCNMLPMNAYIQASVKYIVYLRIAKIKLIYYGVLYAAQVNGWDMW